MSFSYRIGLSVPDDVQSLEDFLKSCPQWYDPDSYICDQNNPIQRVNRAKSLDFIHAPVVLEYYTASRSDFKVYDINGLSALLPGNFNTPRTEPSSVVLMNKLLFSRNQKLQQCNLKDINPQFLCKHGPILLSRFSVHDDFYLGKTYIFTGHPRGESKGLHAMLLIGVRVHNDSYRYLIQNWWPQSQFVELDADYLQACGAGFWYVTERFPMVYGNFVESNADVPESLPREWMNDK